MRPKDIQSVLKSAFISGMDTILLSRMAILLFARWWYKSSTDTLKSSPTWFPSASLVTNFLILAMVRSIPFLLVLEDLHIDSIRGSSASAPLIHLRWWTSAAKTLGSLELFRIGLVYLNLFRRSSDISGCSGGPRTWLVELATESDLLRVLEGEWISDSVSDWGSLTRAEACERESRFKTSWEAGGVWYKKFQTKNFQQFLVLKTIICPFRHFDN